MNKPQDDLLAAKLNETGRYTASERATGPWLVAYYEAEADYWRRHGGAPQNEPPGNSYECTEHVARCVWEAALASIGQAAPPDREELAKGLHDAYHGGCTRGHLAEADYVLSIWPKAAQPPREQYLSLVCERDELKGRLAETESLLKEATREKNAALQQRDEVLVQVRREAESALANGDEARARGLIPIPQDQVASLVGGNRRERRAWQAKLRCQQRKERKGLTP